MFSSSSPRTATCTSSSRLVDGTAVPVSLDADDQQPGIIPTAADFLAPSPASGAGSIAAPPLAGGLAAADSATANGARTVAETPAAAAGPSRPGTQVGGLSPFPGARPHARIRVDALQLDDLVGLAGELAVLSDNLQGLREISGLVPWLHALEVAPAGQPGDPGHDARPAHGARR